MKKIILCAGLALSACSIAGQDITFKKSLASIVFKRDAALPVVQPVSDPSIQVMWPSVNVRARFGRQVSNRDVVRYTSAAGEAVSLRNGVIIRTEGFGEDLASLGQTQPLTRAEIDKFTRVHRYLDGEYQTVTTVFECARYRSDLKTAVINRSVTPIVEYRERCFNQTREYENSYIWIRASGKLWRSRQWMTPEVQDLVVNH